MDLKELQSGVDPKTHWYYQSKKNPLLSFIKKIYARQKTPLTLIDVGSGSGFFMYEMNELIPDLISKIYLVDIGYTKEEIKESANRKIEKTSSLPSTIENSIVVMMDVLEHLEDDAAMLNAIKKNATGSNHFFITVPAFRSLWSSHDVYLEHYRRYTRTTLNKLLASNNFKISTTYYYYGILFPAVWLARKLKRDKSESPKSDMNPLPPLMNSLLKFVCRLELPVRKINCLAGVTCISEGRF